MPKFLIPDYMKKFNCIGSGCDDNCCNLPWKVLIDYPTYEKINNSKEDYCQELMEDMIINQENPSQLYYAHMKKNKNICSQLDDEYLCKIQLELGHDYLPRTCKLYPRIPNQVDGIFEFSGLMSCPEIVRLALLNKEVMEFEYTDYLTDLLQLHCDTDDRYLFHSA